MVNVQLDRVSHEGSQNLHVSRRFVNTGKSSFQVRYIVELLSSSVRVPMLTRQAGHALCRCTDTACPIRASGLQQRPQTLDWCKFSEQTDATVDLLVDWSMDTKRTAITGQGRAAIVHGNNSRAARLQGSKLDFR